jgi:hypothetical protein
MTRTKAPILNKILSMVIFGLFIFLQPAVAGEKESNSSHCCDRFRQRDYNPPPFLKKVNMIQHEPYNDDRAETLATLLNYFNVKCGPLSVKKGLLNHCDLSKYEERGKAFSLLDMKRYLASIGFTGTGYKADVNVIKLSCCAPHPDLLPQGEKGI